MSMQLPAQFLLWKLSRTRDGSITKLPVNPRTREVCDAHDPTAWATEEEVRATGEPVAFVLTKTDPYFFLDLDACRQGDGWQPYAVNMMQPFASRGAAIEISQSGNGLHIAGMMDPKGVELFRNKWRDGEGHAFEFYFKDRFIAFGADGWRGSWQANCTDLIQKVVPVRDLTDAELPMERDPAWVGPEDDDALIERMMAAEGGARQQFGHAPTIRDLWTANSLDRFFPAEGDGGFDASSADHSLMSHLAFWTGKDPQRMDRLFRRSNLMRDKYGKRKDYQQSTILAGLRGTNAVLGQKKEVSATGRSTETSHQHEGVEQPASSKRDDAATIGQSRDVILASELVQYFDGCVYISDTHRVMLPDGLVVQPEVFKVIYGGHQFQISNYEARPTKCAFEAFVNNRIARPKIARGTCYNPHMELGEFTSDGLVNMFSVPVVDQRQGDVAPFLELVARLLPETTDQRILLTWMGRVARSPGMKTRWAPVLQGVEGNGKSMIMSFMEQAVGREVTHFPTAEDMGEKYNSYIERKLLICVEEVYMAGRRELMDRLKPLIANDRVEIRGMRADKKMADNLTNWIFCTNHKDAIIKTKNDRRYSIFFTHQQQVEDIERDGLGGDYFPKMWRWARKEGFAHVAHYLRTVELDPQYDPGAGCHRAPRTSSTEAAIHESMGNMELIIEDAVASGIAGFRGGYISSHAVSDRLRNAQMKCGPKTVSNIMDSMGYVRLGRMATCVLQEDNTKPTIYRHRDANVDLGGYGVTQGYS